jgi:hypothetical protein
VRIRFGVTLLIILSAALAGIPAVASPATPASAPLGVILQAQRAQVGADVTSGGATIYDGDRLQTEADGTLRVKLGGPQMVLRPNTIAVVHGLPSGFSADLGAGTVVASSSEGQTFQVLANGATIRPAGTESTIAQVTRVNANELLLTSTHGALEVSMGDEVKTIASGSSYRMELEGEDPGPRPGQGPYHPARNRFVLIAIIAVSAATGIVVWRALISPSGL